MNNQVKVALETLKLSEFGAEALGGMNHKEAVKILLKNNYKKDDIVKMLLKAGFSKNEILKFF